MSVAYQCAGCFSRASRARARMLGAVLLALVWANASVALDSRAVARWMDSQAQVSLKYLLENISPPGTEKGVVVASPSRSNPDYFYHWVRDAGLVIDVVVDLYRFSRTSQEKAFYQEALKHFIIFSRRNQLSNAPAGLGEPKFHVDGRPFTGPWGRPQDDGPALRALALTKLAALWLAEGHEETVRKVLYDGAIPTHTLIKADLEYVAHHWRNTSFDLWEEVSGRHFYTRLAQRRALVEGARLAYTLGDRGAGDFYTVQARYLEQEIQRHWVASHGILVPTVDRNGGIDYKNSGLDSSVILAVLHNYGGDGFYSATDERVLSTFHRLEQAFRNLYPVNHKGYPGVAIGRYPEDVYNGNGFGEGNPWVLTTLGFGELLHLAAKEYSRKGAVDITPVNRDFFAALGVNVPSRGRIGVRDAQFQEILNRLRARGDEYIARAGFHSFKDGRLSEQINRHTGYMQGAHDLTWSYAAFITAYWSRL